MVKTYHKKYIHRYQIIIQERLDDSWKGWFNDFEFAYKIDGKGKPVTILTGMVIDQAALNGILTKIWNLNMTILSVKLID